MPIQHAVLALLAAGPSHGYQLKGDFEQAIGPQWGALNIGHLYQILDRLLRDGLVAAERHPQPVKPDRVVYAITPAGTAELDRWLAEPATRAGGFRDDLFLKLTAAARSGSAGTVRTVVTNQRGAFLRELRNLDALRREATDPMVRQLLAAAARHVTADLAFLDDVETELLADHGETLAALVRRAPTTDAGSETTGSARKGPRPA
jgi:DNA-binding PadR family transcriptional regulator